MELSLSEQAQGRSRGIGTVDAIAHDIASLQAQSPIKMVVLTERLADGSFMAVGRERYPLDDLRSGLHRFALWGSVGLIMLAAIAGGTASFLFLRRLERVNETTGRIMDGNLSERLPVIGFGREFDELTGNLNAMLDRLEAAMTAMRQVSTDVAHDLRAPLTRLKNRLEEIAPSSEAQALQVEGAIEEADELLSAFSAMLRLARLEGGSLPFGMAPIDLSELAERAVDAYRPAAEEGGRRLMLSVVPAVVTGDGALLNQLLANLIDNGLYHTPKGTTVSVDVRPSAEDVLLVVSDDGIGVADADLPNLTHRFYRTDHSRNRPGTGLGLTLAAAIAERHRARMTITNRYPGLCVEICFPRDRANGAIV